MFAEPERTRYDLSFHLFRFPVRIHPWFWLVVILFGANQLETGRYEAFAAWVAVVVVSLLVHELGHAFAFRWFGSNAHIVLHSFGGLAVPWSPVRGRIRRIAVSLAGPFAGFALFGITLGTDYLFHWSALGPPILRMIFAQLLFVNLVWGLLNLLPVWPLDGGQVCEELCIAVKPRNGRQIALQISITVAGLFCIYSLLCVVQDRKGGLEWLDGFPWWMRGNIWTAILFGLLAVQSYQVLQRAKWTETHWDRY